jgi:hypothetical protein
VDPEKAREALERLVTNSYDVQLQVNVSITAGSVIVEALFTMPDLAEDVREPIRIHRGHFYDFSTVASRFGRRGP